MKTKVEEARTHLRDALTYVDHVRKEKRVPGIERELSKAEMDAFLSGLLIEAAANAAHKLGQALALSERGS